MRHVNKKSLTAAKRRELARRKDRDWDNGARAEKANITFSMEPELRAAIDRHIQRTGAFKSAAGLIRAAIEVFLQARGDL